jgi:hypothetical protein
LTRRGRKSKILLMSENIAYHELVHTCPGELVLALDYNPKSPRRIWAQNIVSEAQWEEVEWHLFRGNPYSSVDDLPPVAQDTEIIIGGEFYNICCKARANSLRLAGFTNVVLDPRFCYALDNPALVC